MLDLILIGAIVVIAWRLHQLEMKVQAMEDAYNELANLFDELTSKK